MNYRVFLWLCQTCQNKKTPCTRNGCGFFSKKCSDPIGLRKVPMWLICRKRIGHHHQQHFSHEKGFSIVISSNLLSCDSIGFAEFFTSNDLMTWRWTGFLQEGCKVSHMVIMCFRGVTFTNFCMSKLLQIYYRTYFSRSIFFVEIVPFCRHWKMKSALPQKKPKIH